jgi:KUP system potassium uptake protein
MPLVVLATIATIIASQSIITGAASMTRQAIQLGWLPRLAVTQTSAEGYGQIYVGSVNWLLMLVTICLTVGFGKSDNLASAYGIAVSMTMLMTTLLLFIAMREIWHWSLPRAVAVAGALALVDGTFVAANLLKIADGGYVPLLLAAVVYGLMLVWHTGISATTARINDAITPLKTFLAQIEETKVARVPGTAVFLTQTQRETPPVMLWYVRQTHALHEHLFILNVSTEMVPYTKPTERLNIEQVAPGVWRATAHFGFMERPDIPALLRDARTKGCTIDLADVTYFVGHATVVPREDHHDLPRPIEMIFAFMQRNSMHATDYFRLPTDSVVELGRILAI